MEQQNNGQTDEPNTSRNSPERTKPSDTQGPKPTIPPTAIDSTVKDVKAKCPSVYKDTRSEQANPGDKAILDRINQAEIWMIVLTAIIAVATIGNVTVFYLESESGSTQTTRLIDKADSIASSMKQSVEDNKTALDKSLGQNQVSLKKTLAQSKAALDASIEMSHTSQRAWMSLKELRLRRTAQVGNNFRLIPDDSVTGPRFNNSPYVEAMFTNTGNTPAIDQSGYITMDTYYKPLDSNYEPQPRPNRGATTSMGILAKDAPFILHTYGFLSPGMMDQIANRAQYFMVYGAIEYFDVFRHPKDRPHVTRYCWFYDVRSAAMGECPGHNNIE